MVVFYFVYENDKCILWAITFNKKIYKMLTSPRLFLRKKESYIH